MPVERVRAAFHYVRDGVTVRPADLLDAEGLAALMAGLPEHSGRGECGTVSADSPTADDPC